MKLDGTRVLLTGANGGIGSALAAGLHHDGARLAVVGRQAAELEALRQRLSQQQPERGEVVVVPADLLDRDARGRAVDAALAALGGIDLLVNCAGMTSFRPLTDEDPAHLERIVALNLTVPMLLARQVLPPMLQQGSGRIVNVGSTFGSIGFAWFTAYSASKFGLRGLSEALRRELEGSGVGVTYVAPRAVRTPFNSDAVNRMAQATKMHMDDPAWVARRILDAIRRDAKDVYLGFSERLFARLNGLLPRLVDGGLRRQSRIMATYARTG
jgi:short-subunit dehydrogenase